MSLDEYNEACPVYFIQAVNDQGLVKIGTSDNVARRLKVLQMSSPVRLFLAGWTRGGRTFERALHKRFHEERAHGEWFHPSAEVMSFIVNHTEPGMPEPVRHPSWIALEALRNTMRAA